MIIGDKNSNHGILVDSVSISTTKQVKTIYDMSKLKSLLLEGFSKNEWLFALYMTVFRSVLYY
jgi:hypothetical protein